MAFCDKEKQLIDSGITCLDNKFILNYMPDAPDKAVSVYILGLALSESSGADNTCETIAQKLEISPEEVLAAYLYWEELGLVHITFGEPKQIVYLSVRDSASKLKKIKPAKYAKFNRELQNVFEGRMVTTNELYQYYDFLESTTFQPEALIAVAKYCVEIKGGDVGYPYVLTVARNQQRKGATSLAAVTDNLNSQQKYDEDLKLLFKAMGTTRHFEYQDRELFEKWTREFGFTADVIVSVAKTSKIKSIEKLDGKLTEYFRRGVLSVSEIEGYEQAKEHLTDLAKQINRTIGVYYQSVDVIIDEYLISWIHRGFDDETLLAIAKYCFKSGIRTLNGLSSIVDKLYSRGVTTVASLEAYLAETAAQDKQIKSVLVAAGLERNVTNNDRTLYKTWKKWDISDELLLFAAEKAVGTAVPMAYLNKTLSLYRSKGISTVAQAQAENASTATSTKKAVVSVIERATYTDEQINSLFSALDESEE